MTIPDPFDVGALLRSAVAAYMAREGVSQAEVARRAGIPAETLCRSMTRPDAAPKVLRAVCRALGLRVELVPVK